MSFSREMRPALPILVGASVMLSLAMGLRQSLGLFMTPLTRDTGITVSDFTLAIAAQNLILPAGTSKIGGLEYDVDLNASPKTVAELNDLPIKMVGRTPIYIRDVAFVRNGFPPQTNIVHVDGGRSVLLQVLKYHRGLDHYARRQREGRWDLRLPPPPSATNVLSCSALRLIAARSRLFRPPQIWSSSLGM